MASTIEYNSVVTMQLQIGADAHAVAQITPSMLIMREPTDLPACSAEMVMTIDGRESRWTIVLPDGASKDSVEVRIQ
jgi:hypothetical protein